MTPLFLMSPPRADWRLRGRANPFSQAVPAQDARAANDLGRAAVHDWLHVADAIEKSGGVVVVMPAADDPALTGLPYTAEAGVLLEDADGPVFVVAHLTPPHRVLEADVVERSVGGFGLRTRRVAARFEGQGDVLRIDADRFVLTAGQGRYARTVPAAFDELAALLPTRSHRLGFHAEPWFHGNTFLGAFSSVRGPVVLLCEDALLPGEREPLLRFLDGVRVVPITREESLAYATNTLQVNDTVLVPAGIPPRFVALFRELGLTVRELALPALFSAGGGAAVCLTNRLDGLDAARLPPGALYRAQRERIAAGVA